LNISTSLHSIIVLNLSHFERDFHRYAGKIQTYGYNIDTISRIISRISLDKLSIVAILQEKKDNLVMEISPQLLKEITETKYLTAENHSRYRVILRFFFLEYEKIRYWLYKEDVYAELSRHFEGYTMEQCKQDLAALTDWGNIAAVQDSSKVATVEEFKNKQFRYYLSEYTVEIERLTRKLESLFVEGASLSPNLFERIRLAISKIPSTDKKPLVEIDSWWKDLQSDFRRLNQNYQDYIRNFYSADSDRLMKSQEFIVYKDSLVKYLREFVKELQKNAPAIEGIIKKLPDKVIDSLLAKVIIYEKSIPRMDREVDEALFAENVYGKWESLRDWFLGKPGKLSESYRVLEITNGVISRILLNASLILQMRNAGTNRKEDYKKYFQLFLRCEDIKEAHRLSSVVFGAPSRASLIADRPRSTESITSSVYDEEPSTFEIKPRVRTYRPRSERSGFADKSAEKERMLELYMQELEEERKLIEDYISGNKIEISALPMPVASKARDIFLQWISAANARGTGRTEEGRAYRLELDPRKAFCLLECDDGMLKMPPYILVFE